jgi:16S rRNA (guanine527-N7)-methyltransferase
VGRESETDLAALFHETADSWGIPLPSGAVSRIIRHFQLVRDENQRVNLIGLRNEDLRVQFIRLVLDAVSAAMVVGDRGAAVDIGSGAGFPGLTLALLHPAQTWTLIEATKKKAAALERMSDSLGTHNVSVVAQRAEVWAHQDGATFQWATARAVGSLSLISELAAPLLAEGGMLVAMRGPAGRDEVRLAQLALKTLGLRAGSVQELELPEGQGARTLVQLEKTAATPARFPRTGRALGKF